jgi:S-DNA-T family DNA segregation ATPase FtsK/SpoIIIE
VVDDQIWSNSRFRICLKVQEKADSVEMLKRPDAAELRDTGRFYLQVGFNELFKMGQSAWCGAPYVPRDRCESKQDNRVAVIDTLGRVIAEAKSAEVQPAGGQSQVVTIVNYLSKLAGEEGACARSCGSRPFRRPSACASLPRNTTIRRTPMPSTPLWASTMPPSTSPRAS